MHSVQSRKSTLLLEENHAALSLAIVADDLTGACDTAVAFVDVCSAVRVGIDGVPKTITPVWATSTNSRDIEPIAARARVSRLLRQMPVGTQVFKKVDSVFRGNTFDEICSAVETAEYDIAVLSPAHPNMGRRVVDGMLMIREVTGERTIELVGSLAAMQCPVAKIAPGLSAEEVSLKMRKALAQGERVMLCDAVDPEDLRTTVKAARSLALRVLWIGAGGLARALAEDFPVTGISETTQRKGDVLFFIGSNHPATRSQVRHLQRVCGVGVNDGCRNLGSRLVEVPYGAPEEDVKKAVSGILPEDIGCLFLTGGDTARLVCRALGISSLLLTREFAAGVAEAVAEDGAFAGVSVVLKSGAFGQRGILRVVLDVFEERKEVMV